MSDDPMARLSASLKRAIMRELDIPSDGRLRGRRPFTNGGRMSSDAIVDDLAPLPAWMMTPDDPPEDAT